MTKTRFSRLQARRRRRAALVAQAGPAAAFCGFYVAQADSKLFNKSSKVVLTRDGSTTAITMASDYEGSPKEFALVIPVPTFIERKQIGVVDMKTIDHLDAFTAPRLVEYHDFDPCAPPMPVPMSAAGGGMIRRGSVDATVRYKGVTVEASYDVGEYDVSILSATESDGLVNFLTDNGYKIPAGAEGVLGSYIKQKMRFFVAKVNLDRMQLIGSGYLRPLQVRYDTPKFMLPLRLGTVNANGPQDLIIYRADQERPGRDHELPHRQGAVRHGRAAVRQERLRQLLQGDVRPRGARRRTCARCSPNTPGTWAGATPAPSDPLSNKELVELGVRWIGSDDDDPVPRPGRQRLRDAAACALRRKILPRGPGAGRDARPLELPGPLRAAPPVDAARRPAPRARNTAPRCRPASARKQRPWQN